MDLTGWLDYFWVIVVFILAVILAPIFIPETWILRYHAMNLAYLVGSFCLTLFTLIASKIISMDRCIRFSLFICRLWIELMGWDVRCSRGVDILVETKNAVVVINHQSFFDVFPLLPVWPRISDSSLVFMGSELKDYSFLGRSLQKLSFVRFLNRRNNCDAMKTLISETTTHFENGENNKIIIFPEGSRNLKIAERNWEFLEFKPGAFRVAKGLNVPVIPVVISPFYFIEQQRHYFSRGKSIVSVLEPVHPGDESVDELADRVKSRMQDEFFNLKKELVGNSEAVVDRRNGRIK